MPTAKKKKKPIRDENRIEENQEKFGPSYKGLKQRIQDRVIDEEAFGIKRGKKAWDQNKEDRTPAPVRSRRFEVETNDSKPVPKTAERRWWDKAIEDIRKKYGKDKNKKALAEAAIESLSSQFDLD